VCIVLKSRVVKRSVAVSGHKTSISLEDAFWRSFREIAQSRQATLSTLLASIDSERYHGNLSSAIRLFVLDYYREALSKCAKGGSIGELVHHFCTQFDRGRNRDRASDTPHIRKCANSCSS